MDILFDNVFLRDNCILRVYMLHRWAALLRFIGDYRE